MARKKRAARTKRIGKYRFKRMTAISPYTGKRISFYGR